MVPISTLDLFDGFYLHGHYCVVSEHRASVTLCLTICPTTKRGICFSLPYFFTVSPTQK